MKRNVFVFPCGTEIGLEIHKSLYASTHFNLIGGSSSDDHGRFVYSCHVGSLPFVTAPDFIEQMNAVVKEHDIDIIIPAHDGVLLELARANAAGKLKCQLLTSPLAACETACSKLQTYRLFAGKVPIPKMYQPAAVKEVDLPVFLKPEVGNGSRGTYLAKSLAEVKFYTSKDPTLLALEYLPGKEYTVDCFTNRHGDLLFCEGRLRQRISNGISVNSATVYDERFLNLARRIGGEVKFRGAWFYQVKESTLGELVLMEIAPRIAGTAGLIRCKGINLVLLSLFDLAGQDVSVFVNDYGITIDRALHNSYKLDIDYDHVYLDFDDVLLIDGKVNPAVMAFVFQCLNKRIKIHLLTKHNGSIHETLSNYRLSGIFDEVIHVAVDSEKHLRIPACNAIFVDDSFAERKKVHEKCKIPTFDVHMIESLMQPLRTR